MKRQCTLKSGFTAEGKGLHTGVSSSLRVEPGLSDEGILFFRSDKPELNPLKASALHIESTVRCTALGNGEITISTAEHFLAAASGLGINNLRVYINASELPILDGSSAVWTSLFKKAGIAEQEKDVKIIDILRPIAVTSGSSAVMALPSETLRYTFVLDYPNTPIGTQMYSFVPAEDDFEKEIAPARTFAFYSEIKELIDRNLIKGGDLSNALVIKEDGFSSPMIFENEPARHKCLDLIGDLSLCGGELKAHVIALKSGHALNAKLAVEIEKYSHSLSE